MEAISKRREENHRIQKRAATISVVVGVLLLLTKTLAWTITGSSAVLSDAAESIINVAASIFAFASIRLAAEPPDENHPYGHGKIEYFSAGFEGGLIVLAAVAILVVGIKGLLHPPDLRSLGLGTMLVALAGAANGLLGFWLIAVGRRSGSSAIEADGKHLVTDLVTSAGVVVGLLLVKMTGWPILDPVLAILLGVNILFAGWRIVRTSAGRLMDEADEGLLQRIVDSLNRIRQPGDLRPHHLRARWQGQKLYIDLHIFLPRWWTLTRVHDRVDELEAGLARELDMDLEAIIHADPCRKQHCRFCALENCPVRGAPQSSDEPWSLTDIASTGIHPDFGD
ncbi:MAG TPA: cation transporter [Planctomycetes bacterium]|nr:cation transporter [Planctomycetota bacterium]